MSAHVPSLHAIIPAGGAGTRLWPLSRAARPKFLLDLDGSGRSLLQQTRDRLAPLVGTDRINVVTGLQHREAVAAQLPDVPSRNIVAEPSPRDSMAAIGLMTALIRDREPDAVVGSFAADHLVHDQPAFASAVEQAVQVAQAGFVATIGIEPTSPSTAYGYVEAGAPLTHVAGAPDATAVRRFVEKPPVDVARDYLRSGAFRWNAGMFVSRADVLLDHLDAQLPRMREGLDEIAAAWDTAQRDSTLERVWPTLTKIAIDHAIAEPVAAQGGIAMVRGDFGWTDVGDFDAVGDALGVGPGETGVVGTADDVVVVDGSGLVVTSGRTVSVVGLSDVVVVDAPDAVLVTTRDRAQEVKYAVEHWREAGRTDLL